MEARGKRPARSGWQAVATTDPAKIANVFGGSRFNIGVATGARSAVWTLDVDVKRGACGLETLADLERQHGALPMTWRSATPSGGMHVWFRYPSQRRIGNRAGCAPGLDVRGEGGFVVVPPSSTDAGRYRWIVEPTPDRPAEAPGWLLDLVAPPPPTERAPPRPVPRLGSERLSRYWTSTLSGELERVATAQPGSRNAALFRASCALGSLAHIETPPIADVTELLFSAATQSGLVADDGARSVRATIASGLRCGMARPRSVPA